MQGRSVTYLFICLSFSKILSSILDTGLSVDLLELHITYLSIFLSFSKILSSILDIALSVDSVELHVTYLSIFLSVCLCQRHYLPYWILHCPLTRWSYISFYLLVFLKDTLLYTRYCTVRRLAGVTCYVPFYLLKSSSRTVWHTLDQ